jgi:CheY-like chemotaxis protein
VRFAELKMENKILHVEDNPDDVMLMNLAFTRAGIGARLHVVNDGDEAIAALEGSVQPGGAPPVCVLLDVKLPRVSGLEVLAWIRNQPQLKRLPVILLTSSSQTADINRAYDLGANSFLVKPPDLNSLTQLVKTVAHYWVQTNVRPVANA